MMVVAGFEPIDEISRFTLQATAEDTIHKVVLRGRVPEQPSWVRMALDYRCRDAGAGKRSPGCCNKGAVMTDACCARNGV